MPTTSARAKPLAWSSAYWASGPRTPSSSGVMSGRAFLSVDPGVRRGGQVVRVGLPGFIRAEGRGRVRCSADLDDLLSQLEATVNIVTVIGSGTGGRLVNRPPLRAKSEGGLTRCNHHHPDTQPDTIIWYNEARGPLRGDDAHPGQGMDREWLADSTAGRRTDRGGDQTTTSTTPSRGCRRR